MTFAIFNGILISHLKTEWKVPDLFYWHRELSGQRIYTGLVFQERSEKQDVKNSHCRLPGLCTLTSQSHNLTSFKNQTLVFPRSATYSGNAFHVFGKDRIR